MIEGIGSLVDRRFFERRDQSREFAQKLRKAVKRYRQKKRVTNDFPEDLLKQLARIRPSESAKAIQNVAIAWTFYGLGETLSFTPQDLADETGIDLDTVNGFLERMSLGFGEVDPRYRVPAPTHPLMTRPLIRIEQRYFCPVVHAAFWSLRPAIEMYLNPDDPQAVVSDSALWERYNQARADYLEGKAVEYLAEALHHAQVYRNLTYTIVEDGEAKQVELDGLLILDSALFLVEAKAGSLSLPARRGAPKRMIREIEELVEDAYSQALRAKRYIQESDKPVFLRPDGTEVVVPKDSIDRVFLITVTLESLDPYVTTAYQLQELGLFAEGDLPWAVCLADLRVISELVEFPSQLVHYLTRRQRLNELQRLTAHDELDWFGHYLSEGLFFDELLEEPDASGFISLASYTTVFDDYYFYVTGQRDTPAPKPVQPMPEIMRQVLAELEALHPPGYLEAACTLLNRGGDTREKFAELVVRYREAALADRAVHDCTLGFDKPSFGITYMFAPRERASELEARLETYCNLKKYQTQSQLWVGFGCLADEPGWVHMGVTLKEPWGYDEDMEKAVAEMLPPLDSHLPLA
jgi:hypothetical protein